MALTKIGGLWVPRVGSKAFLSGRITLDGQELRVVVFENRRKQGRQPDYEVMLATEDGPPEGGKA